MSCDCPKCTPEAAEARETSRRLIGELRKQRDELLTVLNLIMTRFGECEALDDIILTIAEDPSTMTDIIDKARAAIQKAEGNLSSVRGA